MHGFYYLVELVYLKYAYLKKLGRLTLGFPELVQECAWPRLVIKAHTNENYRTTREAKYVTQNNAKNKLIRNTNID